MQQLTLHSRPLYAVVEIYELSERHIVIPMAITAGLALVLLISLVALYKYLAPIREEMDNNLTVKHATSKLAVMEHELQGDFYASDNQNCR